MVRMSAHNALKWPLLALIAFGGGVVAGHVSKSIEDELRLARIEGLCRPEKSWTAHVSTDGAGFVCFKQQIYNKRIIKYAIVENEDLND